MSKWGIGWAIINHCKSAIVNDGEGQKQIYRLKKLAEEKVKKIGFGTSVIKIKLASPSSESREND